MPKCIGLIGGIGVGAANHYYSQLAAAHSAHSQVLDLVMVHADMNRTLDAVEANDPAALAAYFAGIIHRLEAAGADFAVIPSVTSHYPLTELRAISPLPILDIFAPLNREVAARNVRRIAVFGSKYSQQTRLYGRVPALEFVPSTPAETALIHDIYMTVAWRGSSLPEEHAALTTLAQELIRREGLDAILFGGTDLSLVFTPENTTFPAIDAAALHIAATAEAAVLDVRSWQD